MSSKEKNAENYYLDYNSNYAIAERTANAYNLTFLLALTIISVVVIVLSAVGVFTAPKAVVIPICLVLLLIFALPVLYFFIHDIICKKEPSLFYWKWFKYVLVAANFLGIAIFSVYLSFHAILLLVVPALMMAQYSYNKRDLTGILIASIILVPIGIYGSYFFGIPDRNLLKDMYQEASTSSFDNRISLLSSKRAWELFLHHCIPRVLAILTIDLLIIGISRRNKIMLDKQADLTKRVSEEMTRRNEMQTNVIEQLATVIETRDSSTGEHIKRTKKYVAILVDKLALMDPYKDFLTPHVRANIISAAPMHDIGKITVSDLILLKPGKLTDDEFEQMKHHAELGGKMIEAFFAKFDDMDFIQEAYDIAVGHHERWDGTGYPKGLKEEEIPLAARIMAVADVFDALTSKRVYKDALPADKAYEIIVEEAGKHFDPTLIEVFKDSKEDFFRELGD